MKKYSCWSADSEGLFSVYSKSRCYYKSKKKKVLLFFYLCQIEDVDVTNVPRQVADNLLEFADKWARLHVRMPKGLDEVSFSKRIDMQSELPKSSNQSINTVVDY